MIRRIISREEENEIVVPEKILAAHLVPSLTIKQVDPTGGKILGRLPDYQHLFEIYDGEEKVGWAGFNFEGPAPDDRLVMTVSDDCLLRTEQLSMF